LAEGSATAGTAEAWVDDPKRFAVDDVEGPYEPAALEDRIGPGPRPRLGRRERPLVRIGLDVGRRLPDVPSWTGTAATSTVDGATCGPAEPSLSLPKASGPIPIGRNVLRGITGTDQLTTSDRVVLYANPIW
jgi:hypothetical protein